LRRPRAARTYAVQHHGEVCIESTLRQGHDMSGWPPNGRRCYPDQRRKLSVALCSNAVAPCCLATLMAARNDASAFRFWPCGGRANSSNQAARFAGDIPGNYDSGLGPHLFVDYAADLARRAATAKPSRVLDIAAGTGIVTRLQECGMLGAKQAN
jgi:hypothetical protein